MKKTDSEEMRAKYDFSSGVRGKYLPRLAKGANVVVLDRDMAKVFPTSKSVNDALRVLSSAAANLPSPARCAFEDRHRTPTAALPRRDTGI